MGAFFHSMLCCILCCLAYFIMNQLSLKRGMIWVKPGYEHLPTTIWSILICSIVALFSLLIIVVVSIYDFDNDILQTMKDGGVILALSIGCVGLITQGVYLLIFKISNLKYQSGIYPLELSDIKWVFLFSCTAMCMACLSLKYYQGACVCIAIIIGKYLWFDFEFFSWTSKEKKEDKIRELPLANFISFLYVTLIVIYACFRETYIEECLIGIVCSWLVVGCYFVRSNIKYKKETIDNICCIIKLAITIVSCSFIICLSFLFYFTESTEHLKPLGLLYDISVGTFSVMIIVWVFDSIRTRYDRKEEKSMAKYNVFLDSNIIINAKYNFARGALGNLKKLCENGTASLYTNEIILKEISNHIENDVGLMARQVKNSIKDRGALINGITRPVYNDIEDILLNATKNLQNQFDYFMNGAVSLSNEGLSIITLFDDYFQKRAPFENKEEKKHEFPDAVAIMSIKKYLEESDGTVLHIVTDDKGWHNALAETEGVFLYKELKTLLTKIAEDEEAFERVTQYMEECVEVLRATTLDWFESQDWSSCIDGIELCIECEDIEEVRVAEIEMFSDGIEYIDCDEKYASALFSGYATVCLAFEYIDHTNETYDRESNEYYNTIYGNGTAEFKIPYVGTATILMYDDGEMELNSLDFDEINLGEKEMLNSKLIPYRSDEDVYYNTCPDCGTPIGVYNDGGNGFCIDCAPNH